MASLGERRVADALAKLLDEPLLARLDITAEESLDFSAEPKRTAHGGGALQPLQEHPHPARATWRRALAEEQQDGAVGSTFDGCASATRPSTRSPTSWKATTTTSPSSRSRRALRLDFELGRRILSDELIQLLEARKVRVEFTPPGKGSVVRRYDPKKRALTLSPALTEQPLKFQLAASIGLRVLDERSSTSGSPGVRAQARETPRLIKVHLANYFAGALLLPYGDFFSEVERTRYDIELLVEHLRDDATRRSPTASATSPTPSGRAFRSTSCAATSPATSPSATRHGLRFPEGGGLVRQVGGAPRVPEPVADHAAVLDDAGRHDVLLLRQGAACSRCRAPSSAARRTRSASAPTPRAQYLAYARLPSTDPQGRGPRRRQPAASASAPTATSARRRASGSPSPSTSTRRRTISSRRRSSNRPVETAGRAGARCAGRALATSSRDRKNPDTRRADATIRRASSSVCSGCCWRSPPPASCGRCRPSGRRFLRRHAGGGGVAAAAEARAARHRRHPRLLAGVQFSFVTVALGLGLVVFMGYFVIREILNDLMYVAPTTRGGGGTAGCTRCASFRFSCTHVGQSPDGVMKQTQSYGQVGRLPSHRCGRRSSVGDVESDVLIVIFTTMNSNHPSARWAGAGALFWCACCRCRSRRRAC